MFNAYQITLIICAEDTARFHMREITTNILTLKG